MTYYLFRYFQFYEVLFITMKHLGLGIRLYLIYIILL